jgi:hypothetical protein
MFAIDIDRIISSRDVAREYCTVALVRSIIYIVVEMTMYQNIRIQTVWFSPIISCTCAIN